MAQLSTHAFSHPHACVFTPLVAYPHARAFTPAGVTPAHAFSHPAHAFTHTHTNTHTYTHTFSHLHTHVFTRFHIPRMRVHTRRCLCLTSWSMTNTVSLCARPHTANPSYNEDDALPCVCVISDACHARHTKALCTMHMHLSGQGQGQCTFLVKFNAMQW